MNPNYEPKLPWLNTRNPLAELGHSCVPIATLQSQCAVRSSYLCIENMILVNSNLSPVHMNKAALVTPRMERQTLRSANYHEGLSATVVECHRSYRNCRLVFTCNNKQESGLTFFRGQYQPMKDSRTNGPTVIVLALPTFLWVSLTRLVAETH